MDAKEENSRSKVRLKLKPGIKAGLRLLNRHGILISPSTGTVLVLNLSQEGLCFWSSLRLPVHRLYMVEIRMKLSGKNIRLQGNVVWRKRTDNVFEYGMHFEPPLLIKSIITRLLNEELLAQHPQQRKIHQLYRSLNARSTFVK